LSGGRRNFRGPQPVCLFGHHAKFVFLSFIFCFQLTFIKRITKLVTLASWFWWPYLRVTPGHFINLLWLIIHCICLSFFQRAYAITSDDMVISQRLWSWRIPRRADPGESFGQNVGGNWGIIYKIMKIFWDNYEDFGIIS